jgi:nucleoside-diphosphate-sugar epimerase
LKVFEFLYRRVDIEDVVNAHILAALKAPIIKFDKFIISSTSPFELEDMKEIRINTHSVLLKYVPNYEIIFKKLNWVLVDKIDRVYINKKALDKLDWKPKYTFGYIIKCLEEDKDIFSNLSLSIGSKGYHNI